ncbi:MAG: transcriptional repressor [Candidatus Marinimicrobia bacterium]|nr:transcriptional repressor [Candidatus Neomarinimicrobiota bacterium]
MRYSKQRKEILEIIKTTNSHPTADWIYERVRTQIPNISLGTVYRNLRQLVDNDLIHARTVNGMVHYDGNLGDHQHFYCTDCGILYDLDLSLEDFVSEITENLGHVIHECDLQFNGICNSCQQEQ